MLSLLRDLRLKYHVISFGRLLGRAVGQTPYRAAAIAVFRLGADRVAGLEGEVGLDIIDGGVVVILDLAELQEAVGTRPRLSILISRATQCAESEDLLLAALGRVVDEQVDGDVAGRRFEEDRHRAQTRWSLSNIFFVWL